MARIALLAAVVSALAWAAPASAQQQGEPPPVLNVVGDAEYVEQGPGQWPVVTFTVTLSKTSSQEVRFGYGVCCGNTDSGYDHSEIGGNVAITPGQTTYKVTLEIQGDSNVETDEFFEFYVANVQNATVGDGRGRATIIDDDGRPPRTTIDVADAGAVSEETPAGAPGRASFSVTLSNAATAPMSIDYTTADDTAIAGDDYESASGRLTFAPGERSKTVVVSTLPDRTLEEDERLRLVLSSPSAAGPGRGTGFATILNDDAAPPPPEPQEHTLLGLVTYLSPFGPGFERLDLLGPFASPARDLREITVQLQRPDGSLVAEQRLEAAAFGHSIGPIPYRFDRLGPCRDCTLVLLGDRAVRDRQVVSFGGEPGETDVDLEWDRESRGGVVEGTVHTPLGARSGGLRVAIFDAGGRLLADDERTPRCEPGGGSVACTAGTRASFRYRLIRLPREPVPVRVVLRQQTMGGVGRLVDVDSAEFTLDPSGRTEAPDLTAVGDVPTKIAGGRTVYGQINFRRPFAPGEREKDDLDVPSRDLRGVRVELRGPDGQVRDSLRDFDTTALGYTGFTFRNVAACSACTVVLREDRRTVDEAPITIPDRSPSLTRKDLNFTNVGEPEFLLGAIVQGPASTEELRVELRDAVTGAELTSSPRRTRRCGTSPQDRCAGNRPLYRLGAVPPDRDVVLTLFVRSRAVDQQVLRTASAGEVTQAPLLVVPYGRGARSLHGYVRAAGPFAPGGDPVAPDKRALVARLLDAQLREIARTSVQRAPDGPRQTLFALGDLPPCEGCTLELLDGAIVSDRVAVDVRPAAPSVAVQDLGWQALSGGLYMKGDVVIRRGDPRGDDRFRVQVLAADGRVLADSSKLPRVGPEGLRARRAYRLGGIPRDAGTVKVVVLDGKGRRVSAKDVVIPPGVGDVDVPDLRIG